MRTLLLPAQLTSFARRNDNSVRYTFTTLGEVSNKDFSLIDQYFQKEGWLAFKLDEIDTGDLPSENTEIKGKKSRSQLLRLKIFALHMKQGGTKETFPAFYDKMMDSIDQAVQDKIDALEG